MTTTGWVILGVGAAAAVYFLPSILGGSGAAAAVDEFGNPTGLSGDWGSDGESASEPAVRDHRTGSGVSSGTRDYTTPREVIPSRMGVGATVASGATNITAPKTVRNSSASNERERTPRKVIPGGGGGVPTY